MRRRWKRAAIVASAAVVVAATVVVLQLRDDGTTTSLRTRPQGATGAVTAPTDPPSTTTTGATATTAPQHAAKRPVAAKLAPATTAAPIAPATTTTVAPIVDDCRVLVQQTWAPLGPNEAFVHRVGGAVAKIDVVTGEVGPALLRDTGIMRLSVDGGTIYYHSGNYGGACDGVVYAMPATGGSSRKLLDVSKVRTYVNSRVAVTRDDRFILYNGGLIELATGAETPAPELSACVPLSWTLGDTHVFCAQNGSGPLHVFDARNSFVDSPIEPPEGWAYSAATVSRSGLRVASRYPVGDMSKAVVVVIGEDGAEGDVLGTIDGYSAEYLSVDVTGRRVLVGGNGPGLRSSLVLVEVGKPNRVFGAPSEFSSAIW